MNASLLSHCSRNFVSMSQRSGTETYIFVEAGLISSDGLGKEALVAGEGLGQLCILLVSVAASVEPKVADIARNGLPATW